MHMLISVKIVKRARLRGTLQVESDISTKISLDLSFHIHLAFHQISILARGALHVNFTASAATVGEKQHLDRGN